MNLTKNDIYGIVGTFLAHLVLLLILLFFVLKAPVVDPPLAEGMEIDFGMSAQGSGNDNSATPTSPNNAQVSNVTNAQVTPSVSENIKTSTAESDAVVSKPDKKPVEQPKKPVEEPKKPAINSGALMPGKPNTGGQGNTNTAGNQGVLTGNPNGGGTGGTGTNPNGPGSGKGGISLKLDGRAAKTLVKPRYNEQEDGTVVVKITVDRNGKVVNATTDGVRGSTTTNKNLHAAAIEAARNSSFNLKADAPPEQIGYITYTFVRD